MNISDFFNSNSSVTNFINNLCALLNIVDTSTVKVVGVYSGSTTITSIITPPVTSSNATSPSISTTASALSTAISDGSLASQFSGTGFGTLIGASSVLHLLPTNNDNSGASGLSGDKIGLIVGCVMAGVALIVGSVVTFIYCIRKRSKIAEQMVSHE